MLLLLLHYPVYLIIPDRTINTYSFLSCPDIPVLVKKTRLFCWMGNTRGTDSSGFFAPDPCIKSPVHQRTEYRHHITLQQVIGFFRTSQLRRSAESLTLDHNHKPI
jgi:hypothetical protein